jgi:hypothetical protein
MRKIACHYLQIEKKLLPDSPCVVVFDESTKALLHYYPFSAEEPFTEWHKGTIKVVDGKVII